MKLLPDLKFQFNFPSHFDANVGSAIGISDLQEYHNLDPEDIMHGKITNYLTKEAFYSKSKLTSNDALKIASAAKESGYLENYVTWLQTALKFAKQENKPEKILKNIKKLIRTGKKDHDEYYLTLDLQRPLVTKPLKTMEVTYKQSSQTANSEHIFAYLKRLSENNFGNLLKNMNRTHFEGLDVVQRMSIFLRRRTQKLCRGTYQRPMTLDKDLFCYLVHHENPYLKLGPFKFEKLQNQPEIGYIHEFTSDQELSQIKKSASGHMKSTPFRDGTSNKERSYSKLRTSKVMYINEKFVPFMQPISKRITLATKFKMKEDKHATENFQIMNYGMGGRIEAHLDTLGKSNDPTSAEKNIYGGSRITTFMLYLSDVQAGGHTVFPQAGIHVKPKAGSALYWFNFGAQMTHDTRVIHLGCPVLYGNKWIANKWVKLLAQFNEYPCSIKNEFFTML